MVHQPEVVRVVGEVSLCSKAATFDAKAFAEFNAATAAGNKGQKKQRTISGKQDAPAVEVSYEYDAKTKERTFIMVKPDGVQRGLVGEIIDRFETRGGLKLVARTFIMVKPDGVQRGLVGEIIDRFET